MVCELYLNLKNRNIVWSRGLADKWAAGCCLLFGQQTSSPILVCVHTPYGEHMGYRVTQPWHVAEVPPASYAHKVTTD